MLVWMTCALVVSSLLTAAAFAAEHAIRPTRAPTRWVWAVAMGASLAIPTMLAVGYFHVPDIGAPSIAAAMIWLEGTGLDPLRSSASIGGGTAVLTVCSVLRIIWLVASALAAVALMSSVALLSRRKRQWAATRIAGSRVLLAPDAGPAVFGFIRPRIVVPHWFEDAPPAQQMLILAHEESHLQAHDSRLLILGWWLLAAMPWNFPMWWQLRCLWRAIEVDCDARVLNRGHDAGIYGAMLIEVSQQQSAFVGAVAGMSWPKSLLEERLKILVAKPVRRWNGVAVVLWSLALCLLAIASQIRPC